MENDTNQTSRSLDGLKEAHSLAPIRSLDTDSIKLKKWVHAPCNTVFDLNGKPYRAHGTVQHVTERVSAHYAPNATQDRYQKLLDDMLEGCSLIAFDWTYLYINEAAARHGRKARVDILGRRVLDVYPGLKQTDIYAAYRRVMEERVPLQVAASFIFPDGSVGHFEISIRPDAEGILVLSLDTTEQQRALQESLRSEASKSAILNSVAASIAVLDKSGVIVKVNEPWRRFALENGIEAGHSAPRTDVGTNYLNVCPVDPDPESGYGPDTRRCIQDVLEGRSSGFSLEYPCDSPTQKRWFTMVVTPLANGACEGAVITHTDITRVMQSEEDMRIAATAFNSQEGMMVTDAKGIILRVNGAFTRITGYSAEEAVGQTARILRSGRHNAEFYREMAECVNRTGGWQGEIWDRRKNGEEFPKWLTISAVRSDNGTVTHYVGTHSDISERKAAEQKINELAFYEPLTGLPNRTLLLDRLRQAMTTSSRLGSYGALLRIDLDNFKELNDTSGHEVGDLLLKQVAKRLTHCVRDGDTVACVGGDDFLVILTNLGIEEKHAAMGCETTAEKIVATLNQVYRFGDAAHHSAVSMGITLFNGHPMVIDNLMQQAELAMYRAKESGGNTLRFFDPTMELAVRARAALERDLRQAVEGKNFVLHYQAQVAGGHVTGAEVLVRWKHAQRGMVSPAEFIALAEETRLILPLGHWVLETACTQLAVWATQPTMAHLTIAVNVSALQFRQPDFVDQVLAVICSTGANPYRLKVELTESMLVNNVQDIIEKMFALKTKGITFSLDDFGTGYSSLSYLKRLPLDQLKIDQSFVRDIMFDSNDAAIAKTVIALAQSLGLGVIAEGVETEAQRDFLAGSGCHAYQGYFFSRPLPLESFEEFARQV